jgi:hypothetical protein
MIATARVVDTNLLPASKTLPSNPALKTGCHIQTFLGEFEQTLLEGTLP